MSSDYEFSDNEYYDEDEDAMLEDDGKPTLIRSCALIVMLMACHSLS